MSEIAILRASKKVKVLQGVGGMVAKYQSR